MTKRTTLLLVVRGGQTHLYNWVMYHHRPRASHGSRDPSQVL